MKGYKIEKKKCCCGCSLTNGVTFIIIFQIVVTMLWTSESLLINSTEILTVEPRNQSTLAIVVGGVNTFVTFSATIAVFTARLRKTEWIINWAARGELVQLIVTAISVAINFFIQLWVISFIGIFLTFIYFYYYTVLTSYKQEYRENTKVRDIKSSLIRVQQLFI